MAYVLMLVHDNKTLEHDYHEKVYLRAPIHNYHDHPFKTIENCLRFARPAEARPEARGQIPLIFVFWLQTAGFGSGFLHSQARETNLMQMSQNRRQMSPTDTALFGFSARKRALYVG